MVIWADELGANYGRHENLRMEQVSEKQCKLQIQCHEQGQNKGWLDQLYQEEGMVNNK